VVGEGAAKHKFFWQGCKGSNAGVGLFISEKWINKVVYVRTANEHIMCMKSANSW